MLKAQDNPYTKEEELELGRQVQAGIKAQKELEGPDIDGDELINLSKVVATGKQAQEKLFNAEIGLANKLSKRLFDSAGVRYSLEDIAQDAYVALVDATNTYDPARNCRLSTHAYYKISKMISVRLNRMRSVRLPENRMGQYLDITRAEKEYLDTCVGAPNSNDMRDFVIDKTGLSKESYLMIKASLQPVTSTSAPISENSKFEDLLEDTKTSTPFDVETPVLSELLSSLSSAEQELISVAYGLNIGEGAYNKYLARTGITPEQLDTEAKKILRKLRKEVKDKGVSEIG